MQFFNKSNHKNMYLMTHIDRSKVKYDVNQYISLKQDILRAIFNYALICLPLGRAFDVSQVTITMLVSLFREIELA